MNEQIIKRCKEMAYMLPSAALLMDRFVDSHHKFNYEGGYRDNEGEKILMKRWSDSTFGTIKELRILSAQIKALADILEAETTRV